MSKKCIYIFLLTKKREQNFLLTVLQYYYEQKTIFTLFLINLFDVPGILQWRAIGHMKAQLFYFRQMLRNSEL